VQVLVPQGVSTETDEFWRDSKAVMHRIANPISPVRLRVAPPVKSSCNMDSML
jgi:hypothetical protein